MEYGLLVRVVPDTAYNPRGVGSTQHTNLNRVFEKHQCKTAMSPHDVVANVGMAQIHIDSRFLSSEFQWKVMVEIHGMN